MSRLQSFPQRAGVVTLILVLSTLPAGGGTGGTANQTLTATVEKAAVLMAPGSAIMTQPVNTAFQPFHTSLAVSYEARTSTSGGQITLKVIGDFTPAGGPTVSGGGLTYTCASATLGSPCTGTQTASTTAQTPVLTLPASACTGGGGPCSGPDPNTVNLTFTLTDDPGYSTGSYSANVMFTISAT